MTQNKKLIKHLERRPITTLEAVLQHRILRLSQRIIELEEMGYSIHRENIVENGHHYVRYHLASSLGKRGI